MRLYQESKRFKSEMVRETAYKVDSLGEHTCWYQFFTDSMSEDNVLYGAGNGTLELNFEKEGFDEDSVLIGITWDEPLKIIDYDGVFSLSDSNIQFLKELGFDTSEVEEPRPALIYILDPVPFRLTPLELEHLTENMLITPSGVNPNSFDLIPKVTMDNVKDALKAFRKTLQY